MTQTKRSKRQKQNRKATLDQAPGLNGQSADAQESLASEAAPATPLATEDVAQPVLTEISRPQLWLTVALWLIILLGISCRFVGVLDWDEGAHLHPDERFLTMTVPGLQWPSSFVDYFETEHATLNPFNHNVNFFVYGQLPLVLVKAVATVLGTVQAHWPAPARLLKGDNYDGILYVGRFLSALFDAGTVLLLYLIGKRLGSRWVGLLTAALTSCIALHIQQAHFFAVDTFATFFVAASFLAAMRQEDAPKIWPVVLAGIWLGAAMACKISAALFLLALVPLVVLQTRSIEESTSWLKRSHPILLLFIAAFCTFRIFNPIAFNGTASPLTLAGLLDIRPVLKADDVASSPTLQKLQNSALVVVRPGPQFWGSVREQQAISAGESDLPWNLQWVGHSNYFWPLRNLMLWGVGWPLMLAGVAGMGFIFWCEMRRRSLPLGLHVAAWWTLLIFLYYAHWYSKFTRYYLLITPFLALCAAYGLVTLWQWLSDQDIPARRSWQAATWASGGAVVGLTALWALAVTSIYTRPHTRMEASRWIRQHIAPGTPVANETPWDDSLPISDIGGLNMLTLDLYNTDNVEKRQKLLDTLDKANWIFISSNRVWGSIPRLPQRWPLTTAYYRALFAGQLGFKPVQEFASYPQLNLLGLHLQFPDNTVEEALTVYDHPRVVLFQKTPAWSRQTAELILSPALLNQAKSDTLSEIRASGWRPDENTLPWLPSPATDSKP